MASLVAEITFGQAQEFIARLGRAGLTAAMVQQALRDDQTVERIVGAFADAARFEVAIKACKFNWVSAAVTTENFPETVFGEVGEGHVLAQPPGTGEGYWTAGEIDAWLKEKVKEGYEAATLADGLDFVAKNQRAHLDGPVIFWASVSRLGGVAYLGGDGDGRGLGVSRRDGRWDDGCRFLLRKVR